MLSCAQVTDHLTDYLEGSVPPLLHWRLRTHLWVCPGCQAFLRSLERLPGLVRSALAPAPEPPLEARAALAAALAALPQPRAQAALPLPASLPERPLTGLLSLLARTQASLVAGNHPAAAPYLPEAILAEFPPPSAWSWWGLGLGGARLARLKASEDGAQNLYLLAMPPRSRFPRHGHVGAESLLVLHGGLEDGARHGAPGDWFHHDGTHPDHAPVADATGCWALVWTEGDAVRLRGWRHWVQRLLT